MVTAFSWAKSIVSRHNSCTEEPVPADEQAAQPAPLPADQSVPADQLDHPGPASQPTEGDAAVPDDNGEKGSMVHTFEPMFLPEELFAVIHNAAVQMAEEEMVTTVERTMQGEGGGSG